MYVEAGLQRFRETRSVHVAGGFTGGDEYGNGRHENVVD
jgi:hypothetical protein